jgi:hypothetical protein
MKSPTSPEIDSFGGKLVGLSGFDIFRKREKEETV